MQKEQSNKVIFVGAGPGDPELITIKGQKAIEGADVIIYAGSLVNKKVLTGRKKECQVYDSASMTLDEVIEVILGAVQDNKRVVRIHTGDPSLYGAIREQIDRLESLGIESEVIPGVSSVFASAAALGKEFTLPGISQTLICTRLEGRTPVPELETLERLAQSRSSMALFLSVGMIDRVQEKLLTSYPMETPVAVVYKASWPEEKIIKTTLGELSREVKENDITHTAQILVGEFLNDRYELSKLYDPSFSHGYRSAKENS